MEGNVHGWRMTVIAALAALVLAGCDEAAQPSSSAWASCLGRFDLPAGTSFRVHVPPGSSDGVRLRRPPADADTTLTAEQMVSWRAGRPIALATAELEMPSADTRLVLTGTDGRDLLVTGPRRLRLLPAGQTPLVTLDGAPPPEGDVLPKGTAGVVTIPLGAATDAPGGIIVQVAEAGQARLVPQVRDGLVPRLVPSDDGPILRVRLPRPGVEFTAERQRELRACVLPAERTDAVRAEIVAVRPEGTGAALVSARVPDGTLQPTTWVRWQPIRLLVTDSDGGNARFGAVWTLWPTAAAVAAALLVAATAATLGWLVARGADRLDQTKKRNWLLGLFAGRDNVPSLSLFQVFLWTLVTLWALVYVALRTAQPVALTAQVMALLGFAGATSVAARWIAADRTPGTFPESKDVGGFWSMVMMDGKPDLLRVQLLAFTLFAVAYVTVQVLRNAAFPVLDDNLLLLMGVSNLTYLGGKLAEPTPLQRAAALQPVRDAAERRLKDLKDVRDKAKKDLDQAQKGAAANPAPPNKLELEAEAKRLAEEVKRLEGPPAEAGEIGKAEKTLADLDKAWKDALASVPRT